MTKEGATLTEREIFALLTEGANSVLSREHFDDAAVVSTGGAGHLVIASDFIRGPQFNLAEAGKLDFRDLAHYLVAANASDISAMGVRPVGFLDVFRYPIGTPAHIQRLFFDGLAEATRAYGVELVGGDSGGYREFVLSGTCFGFATIERLLRRDAARPGQLLCVSGLTGRCRAAQMAYLETSQTPVDSAIAEKLLSSWRRPDPPLDFGAWLGATGLGCAAQDTSDGLGATIADICRLSAVSVDVQAEVVPVDPCVAHVAEQFGICAAKLALSTSPDFALVFTTEAKNLDRVAANPAGAAVHVLGEIAEGYGARLVEKDGASRRLPLEVFDHRGFVPHGSAPEAI